MVFSGSEEYPGPYDEDTIPEEDLEKLTWYGYSKAEGDRYVANKLGDKSTILRIMYPVRASFEDKKDFLRGPLSLYDKDKLYPLINDQQITISFIDEIADSLIKIVEDKIYGAIHVSSANLGTPYEVVSTMLKEIRDADTDKLEQIELSQLLDKTQQAVYRYPRYGGLSVEKTQKKLGIRFNTWQETIRVLKGQGLG